MSHNPTYIKLINCQPWRNLRNRQLKVRPLCEECKSKGIYTSAVEVHHRIPVESVRGEQAMMKLAYDPDNLVSLCHECHIEVHKALHSRGKDVVKNKTEREVKSFKGRYL